MTAHVHIITSHSRTKLIVDDAHCSMKVQLNGCIHILLLRNSQDGQGATPAGKLNSKNDKPTVTFETAIYSLNDTLTCTPVVLRRTAVAIRWTGFSVSGANRKLRRRTAAVALISAIAKC